jgi:hypothetical protein
MDACRSLIGRLEGDEEHAVLAEQLAGWREKYPDVPVRQSVLRGRPAETLLRYGKGAPADQRPRVIVLGTRGRGGLAGLLLGSTCQRVMTTRTSRSSSCDRRHAGPFGARLAAMPDEDLGPWPHRDSGWTVMA